uniref:Uncharacterized protein n=1 Tax=Siphoviridae sp. ctBLh2 TaxID=2827803 RepID=A0A8S5S389_9CAUD|nr:MAG TPA: hypothetical protein [Siphoviridae sp. ctBLh2]
MTNRTPSNMLNIFFIFAFDFCVRFNYFLL